MTTLSFAAFRRTPRGITMRPSPVEYHPALTGHGRYRIERADPRSALYAPIVEACADCRITLTGLRDGSADIAVHLCPRHPPILFLDTEIALRPRKARVKRRRKR